MNRLLLIGGGGHCRSIIDSLALLNTYDEIGIVDNNVTNEYLNAHYVGRDDDLVHLYESGWDNAFVSIGSVGNTLPRRKIYGILKEIGFKIPTIIDSTAVISKDIQIGEGCFVGKKAIINFGTVLRNCCIINSGAIIEHDCIIDEFSHVAPGTVICGNVNIGKDSHIGAGSVVRQSIKIGNEVMVGIGSVVVKNISNGTVAFGNPCCEIESEK